MKVQNKIIEILSKIFNQTQRNNKWKVSKKWQTKTRKKKIKYIFAFSNKLHCMYCSIDDTFLRAVLDLWSMLIVRYMYFLTAIWHTHTYNTYLVMSKAKVIFHFYIFSIFQFLFYLWWFDDENDRCFGGVLDTYSFLSFPNGFGVSDLRGGAPDSCRLDGWVWTSHVHHCHGL